MPRSWPPTISATRCPGKESSAASVGSTLVDRESSMNVTPPTVPTGVRRLGSGVKPSAAAASSSSSAAWPLSSSSPAAAASARRTARAISALRRLCLPGQVQWSHPGRARVVGLADPLDARPEQAGALAEQFAVAVGDGQVRARLRRRGKLVAVVTLDAAVPREVIGVQRRDGGDRRGDREVGRRVAGDLDHPVVVVAAAVRVIGRGTEVAADQGLAAEPVQQVADDRGGRRLALGAGDVDDPGQVGLVRPQAKAADQRHPGRAQFGRRGAVGADARGS